MKVSINQLSKLANCRWSKAGQIMNSIRIKYGIKTTDPVDSYHVSQYLKIPLKIIENRINKGV